MKNKQSLVLLTVLLVLAGNSDAKNPELGIVNQYLANLGVPGLVQAVANERPLATEIGAPFMSDIDAVNLALLGVSCLGVLLLALSRYRTQKLKAEIDLHRANQADQELLYTNMSLGFAVHEVVRDEHGKIVDYRFVEINPAFEKMIGIPRDKWLGRTIKDVLPTSKKYWIENFARVEASGEASRFENYVAELDRWYVIDSYKTTYQRFVVLIQDVTQRKKDEIALKDSEERLRISQHYGGIGIWEADLINNRLIWSDAIKSTLGLPRNKQITWGDFLSRVHVDDRKRIINALSNHIKSGLKYDIDYRVVSASGRTLWMRSVAKVERNKKGLPFRMRGIIQDVTERHIAEEKLKLSARVFSDTHESIVITDAHARIVDVNAAFCELTGFSRDDVIGKNPSMLDSGRHDNEYFSNIRAKLEADGHWQGEVWNHKKNGEAFACLLTVSAIRSHDEKVNNYIGLFSDITETKRQQHALEMLAHYDQLTQLPNRSLFTDRFTQAIAHSKRTDSLLAICYLDLDGFKQVNDNYGHEVGDELLVEVAKRIKIKLREGDTVCRLGGDEFVMLFVNLQSIEQCEETLNRIHQALAEPFALITQKITIAASSGVTLYPLDKVEPEILLRHADQAMYQAKLAGRNCHRFYEHLPKLPVIPARPLTANEELILEIEQALNNQELCLYYQPKVNLKSGTVVGAEALIRWQHASRGLLLPADFLLIIHGTPLEITIGDWVIEQVFHQMQIWQAAGLKLQVSLNVSPRFIQSANFVDKLASILSRYHNIDSQQLELEVLENSVLEDLVSVGEVLKRCYVELGVSYALDDFGTGYSSLNHLRHLIVSTVKIDQSFIYDMIDDPDDQSIVESVIGLAKAFKREVVAEGVESVDHGVFLINLGCDLAQGFAIARPMPACKMPQWVQNYRNHPAWDKCSKNSLTPWQTQLTLLKIQQLHWIKRIRNGLQLPPDNSYSQWPIVRPKKSHLGKWLERCLNDGLIKTSLLYELEYNHRRQCQLAEQLIRDHHQGEDVAMADNFTELLKVSRDINASLESCIEEQAESIQI